MANMKFVLVVTTEVTRDGGLVLNISQEGTTLASLRLPAPRQAMGAVELRDRRDAMFGLFMAAFSEAAAREGDAMKKSRAEEWRERREP
jgi:hypothetical protein